MGRGLLVALTGPTTTARKRSTGLKSLEWKPQEQFLERLKPRRKGTAAVGPKGPTPRCHTDSEDLPVQLPGSRRGPPEMPGAGAMNSACRYNCKYDALRGQGAEC